MPSATSRPAVTRPAPTPVIIATETPAPTPVTYVVQKGDTLVGIAVRYGVSVEALQAANGNVQPQYLSIGAVLVIPSADGEAPVSAGPDLPPPAPVEVGVPGCYPLATGALYCLAQARNPGPAPLADVSVRLTLAGADGLPLAGGVAYAAYEVILPGEAAPLGWLFPAPSAGVAATGVTLVSAAWVEATPAAPRAVRLEIGSPQGQALEAGYRVTAEARNAAGIDLASARLTLSLYDSSGALAGYRQADLAGGLAAGESRVFSLTAASLAGPVDRFTIVAEGYP